MADQKFMNEEKAKFNQSKVIIPRHTYISYPTILRQIKRDRG